MGKRSCSGTQKSAIRDVLPMFSPENGRPRHDIAESFTVVSSAYEATFGCGEEFDEIIDFLAGRHVRANLLNTFGKECRGVEENVVCGVQVVDDFGGESPSFESDKVESAICGGVACNHAEWWNVLRTFRSSADHNVASDAAELVYEYVCADDGEVVDYHFSGKLRSVADDASVSKEDVVCHVHTLHQQVVAADNGTSLGGSATVDGDILADDVVVADFGSGFFPAELKVLGNGTDDGSGENAVSVADTRPAEDGDGVHEHVVVADDHIGVDEAEGTDFAVLSDFRFRMDVCKRRNHRIILWGCSIN